MALEVKKQREKENSLSLIRQFSTKVKRSGMLIWLRKKNYKQRVKSDQMSKRSALRRTESREKYEKMDKMGEIKKFKKRR